TTLSPTLIWAKFFTSGPASYSPVLPSSALRPIRRVFASTEVTEAETSSTVSRFMLGAAAAGLAAGFLALGSLSAADAAQAMANNATDRQVAAIFTGFS